MDKGLETILSVATDLEVDISEKLISAYYDLHKDNQYRVREDRSIVLSQIRRLITDAVTEEVENGRQV